MLINVADKNEICLVLYVKCQIFLSDFIQIDNFQTDFPQNFQYQISRTYKVLSTSSESDFFTRLWVHFGTPLFPGWCPRTPSLPGTRDGPYELWSQRASQSFVSFGRRESCTFIVRAMRDVGRARASSFV